ncbi:hypothetical protein EDB85DRAFT_183110 [Lactarius pseudohatsudake]|nr:hypothetical protein EDB85DRAFT_183110 [Lactarius pseudohatsudake]
MMRRILPRFPFFRTLVPRIARPLLPVTSRISTPTSRVLTRPLRISPFRHIHTTSARSSSSSPPPDAKEPPTLSQRLKELVKAYGWYAVGVYAAVSAADFVVAFVGVNLLGADYVASVAASAKTWLHNLVYSRPPEPGRDEIDEVSQVVATGQEGLYAMFLLAFAVHKTLFLPVRIGVTAAFTPRFVKWLRARGWAGGEGTRRAMQEMRGRLRDRN